MFRSIDRHELVREWHRIGVLLAPAIEHDPNGVGLSGVYAKLMSGQCSCLEVTVPNGAGYLVFEIFERDDRVCCFSSYIAGSSTLKPKAWLRTMRAIMGDFEQRLTEADCFANYIGGRNWSRVFPDYQPADDVPNRLKKVLAHG